MVTLAKNMYPPDDKIDKIAAGYLITPKIPQGLAAAVEGLTREVIRHHPEDIYIFAAQHFEKLLQLREQYSRSMDQQWKVCQDPSIYLDLKDYYKDFNECNNQFHDSKATSRYAKCNKLQKNEEFLKHKRKKAYSREIKTRSPKVISGLTAASKDIKNKLKKNRISTQQNKNGVSRNDKVILTKLDSMDKVKSYVVDKFAQTTSVDELQSMNYTAAVQNVINNNTQVINKKIEELKGNKLSTQQSIESNKEVQSNSLNNSSALETRLNETHNLLKDISSCFPKLGLQSRPRSADAIHNYSNYYNASDKLEAMLNETHHLLLGISKNFFRGNDLQKSKSEDNEHSNNIYLPSVQSTSIANSLSAQRNAAKNGSLTFALPPVTSSSPSPKSAKTKQDLTLPILLPGPVTSPVKTDEADEQKQFENNDSKGQDMLEAGKHHEDVQNAVNALGTNVEITEIEEYSRKETPEQLCYMLTSSESPLFQIPYNVTTVIIPDRSNMLEESAHDQCLNDPFSSLIGEVVSATLTSDEMKELQPALELAVVMSNDKVKFHKQNLQSINEEDMSEEFKEEDKVILEEIIDEEKKNVEKKPILEYEMVIDEKNVDEVMVVKEIDEVKIIKSENENFERENDLDSEPSSTTKETSPTDGPLESPVIYEKTETGLSVSKSTDNVESSNEAKETTLTDGISLLSLDDPVRPYVPELNLDSLQDITVSSFKMTEDECDLQPDDDIDRTNSITETPTLNLNESGDSEEIPAADIDDEKSYVIANDVINGDTLDSSVEIQENVPEPQNPGDVQENVHEPKNPEVQENVRELENSEEMQEDVCILENFVPTSRPPTPEMSSNEPMVIEKNEEEKVEENEEKKEELNEKQDERSRDDKLELKEQQTVVTDDEKKPESGRDQQGDKSVLPDSDEVNPSIEDSIVLKTLLTSQESLELHRMEDAVIRIQAGIRGFLARHRMRKNRKIKDSHNDTAEKGMAIQSEEKITESITEPEEQNMIKLQDTAAKTIQNNFRSYQTRKRLYREKAMQKSTTVSREKTDADESGLQHTGEFHDCIALLLHDISVNAEPVKDQEETQEGEKGKQEAHDESSDK